MRDPKHLGRDLAERMVVVMRTKNVDAQQALRREAGVVAGRANTMVLAQGMRREEVASWVGEVQAALRTAPRGAPYGRPARSRA